MKAKILIVDNYIAFLGKFRIYSEAIFFKYGMLTALLKLSDGKIIKHIYVGKKNKDVFKKFMMLSIITW